MSNLEELYVKFRRTPFPEMGGLVGDFLLYDGVFAGRVESAIDGHRVIDPKELEPDSSTQAVISDLRSRRNLTREEQEFLDYVGLMEKIRDEIAMSQR